MNTGSPSSHSAPNGSQPKYSVAACILAFTTLAYGAHVGLFLFFAEPAPWEAVYTLAQNTSTAYGRILNLWCDLVGESLLAARMLSGLCGMGALLLTARLAVLWGGDGPAAAALTLGFVLFPTAAYSHALAIPDGLTAFLFVLAATLVTAAADARDDIRVGLAGLIAGLLPALHSLGWCLVLAVFLVMVMKENALRPRAVFAGTAGVTVLGLFLSVPMTPASPPGYAVSAWTNTTGDSVASALAANYAMLWVALAFSLIALLASKKLSTVLGHAGRRRAAWLLVGCIIAPQFFIWDLTSSPYPESMAFSAALPLGLLGALPLALWVRRVMPELKSIAVWIVLPVIMYSCFWVILGPIDLNGFPYDTLMNRSVISGP